MCNHCRLYRKELFYPFLWQRGVGYLWLAQSRWNWGQGGAIAPYSYFGSFHFQNLFHLRNLYICLSHQIFRPSAVSVANFTQRSTQCLLITGSFKWLIFSNRTLKSDQDLISNLDISLLPKVIIHNSCGKQFLWNRNWDLSWFWARCQYILKIFFGRLWAFSDIGFFMLSSTKKKRKIL